MGTQARKNFEHRCYSCDASMCSECFSLHNCAEDGEEEEQEEADEEEEAEDDAQEGGGR